MKINIKQVSFIFIIGTLLSLYSCKKDGNVYSAAKIAGNWTIVRDTDYIGVGANNHQVVYVGQPGDYFNILTNGTIYTKEGSQLDTLTYHMVADTGIVISGFGAPVNGTTPDVSHIQTLTSSSLVISSSKYLFPAGVYWRKVVLSK